MEDEGWRRERVETCSTRRVKLAFACKTPQRVVRVSATGTVPTSGLTLLKSIDFHRTPALD